MLDLGEAGFFTVHLTCSNICQHALASLVVVAEFSLWPQSKDLSLYHNETMVASLAEGREPVELRHLIGSEKR